MTTGRLDTRFAGPAMDPLEQSAAYDPQSAAISSAYVAAFNTYVREQLDFGQDRTYKPEIDVGEHWNNDHTPPGQSQPATGIENVMPDLASAMKYNPQLKVMVNGGYYDLATPFYEGWYEDAPPADPRLDPVATWSSTTIESGHMVYAHEESLKALHDNVANFIRRTGQLGGLRRRGILASRRRFR